jgi:hypothetical protein
LKEPPLFLFLSPSPSDRFRSPTLSHSPVVCPGARSNLGHQPIRWCNKRDMSTPQWDLPSSPLLIKTPFLLSRFVFFGQWCRTQPIALSCTYQSAFLALQIYLNLNALVFATWNLGASRAAGALGGSYSTLTSFRLVLNGLWVSRRSASVHNFQWHRNNPLYRLVRNLPFAPRLSVCSR